jgi:hypothetical protein
MLDKKAIKKQYKESLPPMGVYQFKNLKTGKIFIGSGTNLPGKKNAIEFQLKMGSHMNRSLQEDYKMLGVENFMFETLDELDPNEGIDYDYSGDLAALLELWADKQGLYSDNCYNTIKINPDGSKLFR